MNKSDIFDNLNLLAKGEWTNISDLNLDDLSNIYSINPINHISISNKLEDTTTDNCIECECEMTNLGCKNPGCRHKYVKLISNFMKILGMKSDEIKLLETSIDIKTIKELRDKYNTVDLKKLFIDRELDILDIKDQGSDYYNFILPTYKILLSQF